MNWYKNIFAKKQNTLIENMKKDITKEMEEFFDKRTKEHIERVKKYSKKINEYSDKFKNIIEDSEKHDESKFEDIEKIPYILTTWNYKLKRENKKFDIPEEYKKEMDKASEHHVKNNKHHPEYWSDNLPKNIINKEDRDKPPEEIIDATKMSDDAIASMVADWMAMSEELNDDPYKWAKKNINIRWKFSKEQENLIYELLDNIWE